MKRNLSALLLCTLSALLGGCLVMHGSSVEETGPRISPSTLNAIEVGRTREQWLIATLGKPSERKAVDEQTEILKYVNTRTERSGSTVFVLFAGGTRTQERTTTYFELTDGVVTKHWTEH